MGRFSHPPPTLIRVKLGAEALKSNMEVAEHIKKLKCLLKSILLYHLLYLNDFDCEAVCKKSVH